MRCQDTFGRPIADNGGMAGRPNLNADRHALAHMYPKDFDAILHDIDEGLTLRQVADNAGVGRAALTEWLEADREGRLERYNRARVRKATELADQTIEIADNGADTSAPDPARDKLRIQARQWLASRWDRTTYGERSVAGVEVNVANLYLNAMRNVQPGDSSAVTIEHAPPSADPEA